MKKKYLTGLILVLFGFNAKSQTVLDTLTFESLLSQVDTFWNGSDLSGGFQESPSQWRLNFLNIYDTTYSSWEGFAYSSMTDDTTRGYLNQYSCIAGQGADSSQTYVLGYQGYSGLPRIESIIPVTSRASAGDSLYGVYVNNSTYAYYSMLEGDLVSKKFGDTIGPGDTVADGTNGEDWFMLTVYDGNNDSVDFYLADYRFSNDSLDYIIKDWTWVDLSSLDLFGGLDFRLRSSDNDPVWGMNTPAYFCLDNLIGRFDMTTSIDEVANIQLSVFPNPTVDYVTVQTELNENFDLALYSTNGSLISVISNLSSNNYVLDLADLPVGKYILRVNSNNRYSSQVIVKQ